MSALMGLAIDTMFGSIADRFRSMLLNLIMTVISWLEQLGIAFFDSAFVSQTLTFTKGVSWLVLGAAFVVMLLDIGEELGGYRPGQGVEFTTIFTNFIKTIAFVLMAPDLAIIAMQLSVTATGQMSIDYDTFRAQANGVLLDTAVISIIVLIATVAFFVYTLFAVGGIFIQAATVFLYVPDIMRGKDTAMGEWIRQTVAILLTFLFRHLLFVIGLAAALSGDVITMAVAWITMFSVAKLLQKFGASSGFGGMGITTNEFYHQNEDHIIDVHDAGIGFAISVLKASDYHGQEISSLQALNDFHNSPVLTSSSCANEDYELPSVELLMKIIRTFMIQYNGWQSRNVFERQWVLRDFKKYMGVPAETVKKEFDRIQKEVENGIGLRNISQKLFENLLYYWKHQLKLLRGFEKDEQKFNDYSRAIGEWISDIQMLLKIMEH